MRPVIVSVVACVCMWTGPVARSQQAQEPVLIATIPNLQPPDGLRPVSSGGHGYFGGRQRPAAYDAALQLPQLSGDEHTLLRYSLACHLVKAALGGEHDADLLRERAIAYVMEWFKPPRLVA